MLSKLRVPSWWLPQLRDIPAAPWLSVFLERELYIRALFRRMLISSQRRLSALEATRIIEHYGNLL